MLTRQRMSPFKNHRVITFVLALGIINHHCAAVAVPAAQKPALAEFNVWHVYIVNSLSNNGGLSVHCKSKDDDLGIHDLHPGTNFTWSFRENFLKRTLFWCYAHKNDAHAAFKVFWADTYLFYKCQWKNCVWVAKDDGIYIKNLDASVDELSYYWEPGQEDEVKSDGFL